MTRRLRVLAIATLAGALAAPAAGGRRGALVRVETAPSTRVWVAPGRFIMGTNPEDLELLVDECRHATNLWTLQQQDVCLEWGNILAARGAREVWIDGFAIDRREVTGRAYRACVHAGGCAVAPLVDADTSYLGDALPQVNVTRDEAEAFCGWRGGRLPTEAEWEKAARGTDARLWPWGDDRTCSDDLGPRHACHDHWNHGRARVAALAELDAVMRPTDDNVRMLGDPDDADGAFAAAAPASYRGSDGPYGASDQAGNVAEWVADAFAVDGFTAMPDRNPLRLPDPGRERAMVRGGSWRDPPFLGRADLPHYLSLFLVPGLRLPWVGFRCVYTPTLVETYLAPQGIPLPPLVP